MMPDGNRTVSLIRRPGMVNLRLRVNGVNGIVVSGPPHCSFETLWQFYRRNEDAVARELGKQKPVAALPFPFDGEGTLPLFGRPHRLIAETGAGNSMRVSDETIFWRTRAVSREAALAAYETLLRQTLLAYAGKRLEAADSGVALRVRRYKAKWGLCRPERREISLNLLLAALPPHLTDYVLAHELAHFDVPDHSERFYRRLERLEPAWRERRAELKQYRNMHLE